MNTVVELVKLREFKVLSKVIYSDELLLQLDYIHAVTPFDILAQYTVDYNFRGKEDLLALLKKRATHSINFMEHFLCTPLVSKINNSGRPFYEIMKNALRFFHKVDTTKKIYASSVASALSRAFSARPTDGVSLIKFLLKNGIVHDLNTDPSILDLMLISPKYFRIVLSSLKSFPSSDMLTQIYINLFTICATVSSDQLYNYLQVASDHAYLFCSSQDEYCLAVEAVLRLVNLKPCSDCDDENDCVLFNIAKTFVFCHDHLGLEYDYYVNELCANTSDIKVDIMLTSFFERHGQYYWSYDEIYELFDEYVRPYDCTPNNHGDEDDSKVKRANEFFETFPWFRDELFRQAYESKKNE